MSSDLSDAGDSSMVTTAGKRSLVKADVSPSNIEGVDVDLSMIELFMGPFPEPMSSEARRRELSMVSFAETMYSSFDFPSNLKEVQLPKAEVEVDLAEDYLDPEDFSDPEDYSSIETIFFHGTKMRLFWNLEHYPIPDGADFDSIYTNIKFALHKLRFHGWLEIIAYGESPIYANYDEYKYGYCITFTPPEGGGKSTAGQMSRDILDYAYTCLPKKPTVVVLSEEYPELQRVLYSLRSRNHHVLEIVPTPQQGGLFDSVASILGCTQFLGGGTTRPRQRYAFTRNEGPQTGVFWDQVDYPFPSLSWAVIHRKIESALRYRGVVGTISTSVYVGDKPISFASFSQSGRKDFQINYHNGGDNKTARLERMLNDIYLWLIDNRGDRPTKLFVVADGVRDDFEFFDFLGFFKARGYQNYLVNLPKGTGPEISDWPGFLFDSVVTTFT